MVFPDRCIRGIPNSDCLEEGGSLPNLSLFPFHDDRSREDGWIPESINWMDNDGVIDFTLCQKKEDGQEEQFRVGVAILPRSELDRLKKRTGIAEFFGYERAPLANNDYHGNILVSNKVSKTRRNMIRSALALASEVQLRSAG